MKVSANITKLGREDFIAVVKNTPLVSIDLVVQNDDSEVLLGLRKNGPAKDYWFVPGARIFKDERLAQAFERITEEELGVKITYKKAQFLGVFEHLYAENFTKKQDFSTHYVVLAHKMQVKNDLLKLPEDQHSQYKWLDETALLEDEKVHPYSKAYFQS